MQGHIIDLNVFHFPRKLKTLWSWQPFLFFKLWALIDHFRKSEVMMSIYIPSKMELNWDFNMTNTTLRWFCPNCGWYVVCSQKSLLGSHKMTWWHFDSFFMMDHFFTFVTKHENVEFRELMDEKNPSHCIRIILKDSRKVFFLRAWQLFIQ